MLIVSKPVPAYLDDPLRRLSRPLAKHFSYHDCVLLHPIDDPPGAFLVDDSQLMNTPANVRQSRIFQLVMRLGEDLDFLFQTIT